MLKEIALVLALICAAPQSGTGQNSDQNAPSAIGIPGQATSPRRAVATTSGRFGQTSSLTGFFGAQRELDAKIAEAAKTMRQADSSKDRAEAESELSDLLSKDYDERLESYEEEIERLEKAIADMRDKLRKRRDAKEDMIDLRIKVLQAEADDLGWPVRHRGSAFPALIRGEANTQWRPVPTPPVAPVAIPGTR